MRSPPGQVLATESHVTTANLAAAAATLQPPPAIGGQESTFCT